MGSEPIESEIPIELDDMPLILQQAFLVYRMLQDNWEGFNGLYLGKNLNGLEYIFKYTEIDPSDEKLILQFIKLIDGIRSSEITKKREQQKPAITKY